MVIIIYFYEFVSLVQKNTIPISNKFTFCKIVYMSDLLYVKTIKVCGENHKTAKFDRIIFWDVDILFLQAKDSKIYKKAKYEEVNLL